MHKVTSAAVWNGHSSTCADRHAKLVAEAPAKKKTRPLKPKLMVSQKASKAPFSTTLQYEA